MGQTSSSLARSAVTKMGRADGDTLPSAPASDGVIQSFTADGQRQIAEDYVNGKITRDVFETYAKSNQLNFNFISPLQQGEVTGGSLAADPNAQQMLNLPQIPLADAVRPFFEYDGNPADHDLTRIGMGGACFTASARLHGVVNNGWFNWPFNDRHVPPSSENQADPLVGSTGQVEVPDQTAASTIQPPRGMIAHVGFFDALPRTSVPGRGLADSFPMIGQDVYRVNPARMDPVRLARNGLSPSRPQPLSFTPTSLPYATPFTTTPAASTTPAVPVGQMGRTESNFNAPPRVPWVSPEGWALG